MLKRSTVFLLSSALSAALTVGGGCSGCGNPNVVGDGDGDTAGDGDGDTVGDGDGDTAGDGDGDTAGDGDGDGGTAGDGDGDGDGGTAGDGDGDGDTTGDGDAGTDGGVEETLTDPLAEFCSGSGAIVGVGVEGGGGCAGDLAEETFRWAVCACDTVTSSGAQAALSTDSFDSSLGAYGAPIGDGGVLLNVGVDGNVGINGTYIDKRPQFSGSLYIGNDQGADLALGVPSGASYVNGDLYVNGNSNKEGGSAFEVNSVDVDGNPLLGNAYSSGTFSGGWTIEGNVYQPAGTMNPGTVTAAASIETDVPPISPCPCENPPVDVAFITNLGADADYNDNDESFRELADGGVEATPIAYDVWAVPGVGPTELSLPCGRYYFSSIDRSNSATIIAEGRVVIMVGGDANFGGGLDIQIADDAEIDIFVAGSLNIGGGANFGRLDRPSMVRTYVGGESITVGAATTIGGNLYGPNAVATFSASGDFYGAVFVKEFQLGGNTTVHYDSAIRNAGDVCDEPDDPVGGDGGTVLDDGGVVVGPDGGVITDPDGGVVTDPDGGITPVDGGGVDPVDAGPPPPECTDRCDGVCGVEACIEDGMGGGECAPCVTSLDCCAPAICVGGQCLNVGG